MKTYEYHSLIHSFNTYSLGREARAWFITRHQGAGTTHFLHQSETCQNQLFSDEQIIVPNFYSFLDTFIFPGRTWFTGGTTHYLNPWGKQVSLPDTETGSNECAIITHCATCHFFSSRNIKWVFPSHRPAQPSPTPSQDFWPDHPLVSRNALAPSHGHESCLSSRCCCTLQEDLSGALKFTQPVFRRYRSNKLSYWVYPLAERRQGH